MRFLNFDLNETKVVILGQDLYPQPGIATGRAFEVGGLNDWVSLKKNTSLQNILKLLHKNSLKNTDVSPIKDVRKAIKDSSFSILPPNSLFKNWEKQGVLLLNTALTCEIDKPKSHSNYWACFMQKVINFVKRISPDAMWFLWGKNAQVFGMEIDGKKKLECNHPRLNSQCKGDFLFENHFNIKSKVEWFGKNGL
ncbi:MAG: uracil-DNA glycosylase [Candidatus Riflebacteria bacterium]|nr:uracil-DNA glycosylase [Candidatus Riflebacteria bacterium]